MENNLFTTKLHDIIIPVNNETDLNNFDSVFIVMDLVERDISSLFQVDRPIKFTEDHVIYILYNLLCCLNFLETANVIHRDLKPSNILITDKCRVKLCDFGLSRTLPWVKSKMTIEIDCKLSSLSLQPFEAASDTKVDINIEATIIEKRVRSNAKQKTELANIDENKTSNARCKLSPHVFTL